MLKSMFIQAIVDQGLTDWAAKQFADRLDGLFDDWANVNHSENIAGEMMLIANALNKTASELI